MGGCTRLFLAVVFCGFIVGLQGVRAGPLAQEADESGAGETMSLAEWREQLAEWTLRLRAASEEEADERIEAIKERIRNIRDPEGLRALGKMFSEEKDPDLRILYLEPLARTGGPDALRTLVRISVTDESVPVCRAAARLVGELENRKDAVPQYIRYLRSPKYSGPAAAALSLSGLTKRDAYKPEEPEPALTNALINALLLKRTRVRRVHYWREYWGVGPGTRYSGRHEEGFTFVPVHYPVPNQLVLRTLVEYTGEDYGYNQQAWKKWYQERRASVVRKGQ